MAQPVYVFGSVTINCYGDGGVYYRNSGTRRRSKPKSGKRKGGNRDKGQKGGNERDGKGPLAPQASGVSKNQSQRQRQKIKGEKTEDAVPGLKFGRDATP